jgi:hypothetical protein
MRCRRDAMRGEAAEAGGGRREEGGNVAVTLGRLAHGRGHVLREAPLERECGGERAASLDGGLVTAKVEDIIREEVGHLVHQRRDLTGTRDHEPP